MFWSGLTTTQTNDLRIDAIRKFNGFPLAS